MTREYTRPGDLVALDFYYGEGHHLVIDVSFSCVWMNATIPGVFHCPWFCGWSA